MAVIQDGKAVSDVAQENNVHPNMILNWKKEFLENAAMIFDRHRPDITAEKFWTGHYAKIWRE